MAEPLAKVDNLVVHFPILGGVLRRQIGQVHAVDDISFEIHEGETLGLVGESGCGKSTTGRAVMRLLKPDSGRIIVDGHDITDLSRSQLKAIRGKMQIVFQDPFASLSSRMTVHDIIAEPLRVHGRYDNKASAKVKETMATVGLSPEHGNRYAREFSGGQRQRIALARALILGPKILVLDEPVSALDVSIQAQIVNELERLQDEQGLAYLFISHDLSVVRHLSDRVAVMYLGKIVEIGPRKDIYDRPTHPYTQSLLSAVPIGDPDLRDARDRIVLKGDVPSPADPPSGCRFRTRCWKADDKCANEEPPLVEIDSGVGGTRLSACHYPEIADVLDTSGTGAPLTTP